MLGICGRLIAAFVYFSFPNEMNASRLCKRHTQSYLSELPERNDDSESFSSPKTVGRLCFTSVKVSLVLRVHKSCQNVFIACKKKERLKKSSHWECNKATKRIIQHAALSKQASK